MDQLKFKNGLHRTLYCGIVVTIFALACILSAVLALYFSDKDYINVFWIGAAVIAGIWLIVGLVILLSDTIIVTATEIKRCRGNKIKWRIQKDELNKCIHNTHPKWYYFLFPTVMDRAWDLSFNLKNNGLSGKMNCMLSYKQVMDIKGWFGYPIEIIDEKE